MGVKISMFKERSTVSRECDGPEKAMDQRLCVEKGMNER